MISLNLQIFNPKIPTSKNATQIIVYKIVYARKTIAYLYIRIKDDHWFLSTMVWSMVRNTAVFGKRYQQDTLKNCNRGLLKSYFYLDVYTIEDT